MSVNAARRSACATGAEPPPDPIPGMLEIVRHTWPLFLLAIVLVLAGVGTTYYARLKQQFANAPAKPKALAPGTAASYHGWTYTHTSNQKTVITVHADDLQEVDGKQQL